MKDQSQNQTTEQKETSSSVDNSKIILVTGDPICDHNFYSGKRLTADSKGLGFRHIHSGGGVYLLEDLIDKSVKDLSNWSTMLGVDSKYLELHPSYKAYCQWDPQIANLFEKDNKKQYQVWRATEPLLGYGDSKTPVDVTDTPHTHSIHPMFKSIDKVPNILVIDDAGLSFRESSILDKWPYINTSSKSFNVPNWVVMKLTGSIGEGKIWNEIVESLNEKLILIVPIGRLRLQNIRIDKGLSWESTIEDLTKELLTNPTLKPLLIAHYLIVTFDSDGAYCRNNRQPSAPPIFVFDGIRAEGEWAESQGKGVVFGYLSCFTAAIVRELCIIPIDSKSELDFESALKAGLNASRTLHHLGHGLIKIVIDQGGIPTEIDNPSPGFPVKEIVSKIKNENDDGNVKLTTPFNSNFLYHEVLTKINNAYERFETVLIPVQLEDRGKWMMLDEWQVYARKNSKSRPHYEVALATVVLGTEALERFPVAQFGQLQTVDRHEIESLRIIRQLMLNYEKNSPQKKPLSLCVMGPPGAGKSFGVKQLAYSILKLSDDEILIFNLSQFNDTSDLNGAFHQIRDKVLSGRTPLVFWDEFDSHDYKWLQYLLAPMQDGLFQDGQITHPIGKCVFVFAGATSSTFEAFGPRDNDSISKEEYDLMGKDDRQELKRQWLEFKLKKGPDFKSRITGYLNVLGPNPRQNNSERNRIDKTDLCFPVRRAIFIRSQFKVKPGSRLDIDQGILRALLEIPYYKSGARSLEFLCTYLKEHAKGLPPGRSNLPGFHLLNMHVDAVDFLKICEEKQISDEVLKLAAALHEGYRLQIKGRVDRVYLDKPLADIPPDKQRANIEQAIRIPGNLKLAGLHLIEGSKISVDDLIQSRLPEEEPIRQRLADPSMLEMIAEAEHNGWMVERMLEGFNYAPISKMKKNSQENLIPYKHLSIDVKDYDRTTIIGSLKDDGTQKRFGLVDLVKVAGFRLVDIS